MTRKTSIMAFKKIEEEGLLSVARLEVYRILYHQGPMTAGDVFDVMQAAKIGHTIVKGSVCARLTELRDLGVAEEVGTREWGATGHKAILWDVTDALPGKLDRPESKDEIIERQAAVILELEQQLAQLKRNTPAQPDLFQMDGPRPMRGH